MIRYLSVFVSPLIILATSWWFFYYQEGLWWLVGISLFFIILSGRLISRHYFFNFKNLWINLITAYLSQILFLLLLTSSVVRYSLSFLLAVLWFGLFWVLKKQFDSRRVVDGKDYLYYNKFFYYLSFWFSATSIYSLIVFLDLPVVYAILFIIFSSYFWSREIMKTDDSFKFYHILLSIFLLAQVAIAIYFWAVNFYVAGTVLTLWLFFILENILNRMNSFRWYMGLFFLSFIILYLSSIF